MLSLMVAVPMLFGCDMSSAALAAGEAVEEAAEAVQEAVEEQAEVVEEAAETVQEEAAEAVEEAAEPEEVTDITIFITDSKSASKEQRAWKCYNDVWKWLRPQNAALQIRVAKSKVN